MEHRRSRTRPQISFSTEDDLVKYTFKTLVNAGMTPEQVEALRLKSSDPGYLFSKEVVGQRRFATSELLAAGLSNAQIAKVFKSSKQTVAADREHIRQVYTESILQNADNWRAKLIDEQSEIKAKAMQSFEASKQKVVRRTQVRNNGDEIITTEEQAMAGDPSFLNVAKSCLEQQAKLLGLFEKRSNGSSEEKGYKDFLSSISKEVKKLNEAEKNASDRAQAVIVEAQFDEDGAPIGNSRPMLPADPEEALDE
jgi:hypothetical protein